MYEISIFYLIHPSPPRTLLDATYLNPLYSSKEKNQLKTTILSKMKYLRKKNVQAEIFLVITYTDSSSNIFRTCSDCLDSRTFLETCCAKVTQN